VYAGRVLEVLLFQEKQEKGGRKAGIVGFVFGGEVDVTKDKERGEQRRW